LCSSGPELMWFPKFTTFIHPEDLSCSFGIPMLTEEDLENISQWFFMGGEQYLCVWSGTVFDEKVRTCANNDGIHTSSIIGGFIFAASYEYVVQVKDLTWLNRRCCGHAQCCG